MPRGPDPMRACVALVAVIFLVVAGALGLVRVLQNGTQLGALDTEIRRRFSGAIVPTPVVNWANRTAAALCERLDGRVVVVVGNAPTVRHLAETIDAADVVVRVNPAGERHPRPAYEHRGRRTDVVHVNSNHPATRIAAIFHRYGSAHCVWTRARGETALQLGLPFDDARIAAYDALRMVREYPELAACGPMRERFLTAGMLAVLHALSLGARRPVRLAGVTAFAVAGHAVTNSSWRFHEQQLARYHCVDVERQLLRRLVREGAVRVICDAASLFHAGDAGDATRRRRHADAGAARRQRARARRRKG